MGREPIIIPEHRRQPSQPETRRICTKHERAAIIAAQLKPDASMSVARLCVCVCVCVCVKMVIVFTIAVTTPIPAVQRHAYGVSDKKKHASQLFSLFEMGGLIWTGLGGIVSETIL